jgi:hypothetical protein
MRAKVYSIKSTEKECANPNDDVSIQRTIRSMFMRYEYVKIRADDRLLEAHKCKVQTPHATYLNRTHFNTRNIQIRLLLRRALVCACGSVLCVRVFLLATFRQKDKLKCENEVILGVFDCRNLIN